MAAQVTAGKPTEPWHVVVVVPARDEEETIERCLRSLRRASLLVRPFATVDVVVVADRCTDDTAMIASRTLGRTGVAVPASVGSAGAARKLGVEFALDRARVPPAQVWIANTDADSTVPVTWLLTHLRCAAQGAVAVAGVVRLSRGRGRTRPIQRAFAATYLIERDGSHGHVHGANFGIRADVYLAVGGWSPLETGEDHDLWDRLEPRHLAFRTATSFVRTSARQAGRAPRGFAANLATHQDALTPS